MSEFAIAEDPMSADPLDTVEIFCRRADMDAERIDDTELHISLSGSWREVGIWFGWRMDAQMLQIGAPLELKVPEARRDEVCRLLTLVNERLWLGHFDLDGEIGLIYRNTTVLPIAQGLDDCQAEILVRAALDAFDRFFPAFNFVVWGGETADKAFSSAICETAGNA
ncbi:hypothetical protein PB2503_08719 [Parvularcula bermudensis HTCC2503]|uniref:YbjN domain-containing protein n=1 Tax=Parvularcula bermudensis (strain ATCC BAA-594 / HTCC2503 / KCTC 12087) TaxID=314260 RepID=E0TC06_PARBH|nr:YbjN domain-containing protein [Parvularcula bermudensis]ADM09799.1 hypothetical protein PB2503_08719 [Parvularcula bermudensis HTCC2503]